MYMYLRYKEREKEREYVLSNSNIDYSETGRIIVGI